MQDGQAGYGRDHSHVRLPEARSSSLGAAHEDIDDVNPHEKTAENPSGLPARGARGERSCAFWPWHLRHSGGACAALCMPVRRATARIGPQWNLTQPLAAQAERAGRPSGLLPASGALAPRREPSTARPVQTLRKGRCAGSEPCNGDGAGPPAESARRPSSCTNCSPYGWNLVPAGALSTRGARGTPLPPCPWPPRGLRNLAKIAS